jgi:dipeptidyl aminopeptidase/acylaminoacyl peptidase
MPDMDESRLMRELLERTTGSEPPIGAMPQNALRQGIGLRRRRRARFAATGAAAAAVVCAAALGLTGATGHRAATPAHLPANAYVLGGSQTVGTVTPISSSTHQPERPIVVRTGSPLVTTDTAMAVTPDGKTIWVADGSTVTPISTATNAAGTPVRVVSQHGQNGIQQLLMSPDGKTVYGLDWSTLAVTPITTATDRAGQPIDLGPGTGGPAEMAITPNGKTLYVLFLYPPGSEPSYVIPISTATDQAGKPIRIAEDVSAMVVAPDGKTLYLVGEPRTKGSSGPSATIEVTPIATATDQPGRAIPIAAGALGIQTPVTASPDGQTVYIVVGSPSRVIPFSLATNSPGKPVSFGSAQLLDIEMAPDGRTAYVMSVPAGGFDPALGPACANAPAYVTPITTATNTARTPIKVTAGCDPLVITVTPDGKTVYVVSHSGVTPITTATGLAGKRINVGEPQAILTVPSAG